jgi:hypothetical protein
MNRLSRLILVAWSAPMLAVQAQGDAPPLNAAQVLQELDAAEKKQTEAAASDRRQRAAILQEGAAGGPAASRLYEEAVKNTRFPGEGANAKALQDWNKNNGDLLRSPEMQKCVQLHVRYLLLGLQRSDESVDPASLAAPSFAYARDLADLLADENFNALSKEAKELLSKPAAEGIFVAWLNLGEQLPKSDDWEPAAGNLGGILEKNVRSHWRQSKAPELLTTWDLQIASHDQRAATPVRSAADTERLRTIDRPRLIFSRAEDQALLGQQNTAQREMLQLVREHPLHPDWSRWVARLRESLSPAKTTQPPAP